MADQIFTNCYGNNVVILKMFQLNQKPPPQRNVEDAHAQPKHFFHASLGSN